MISWSQRELSKNLLRFLIFLFYHNHRKTREHAIIPKSYKGRFDGTSRARACVCRELYSKIDFFLLRILEDTLFMLGYFRVFLFPSFSYSLSQPISFETLNSSTHVK